MSALEASIENLTAEHTALTQKLEQIDQQYKVERPVIVGQITQLAKALSTLTGKPVAGPNGPIGRKPMSEEGKAAIRAGLEKARAAKQAGTSTEQKMPAAQPNAAAPKPALASVPAQAKKDSAGDKPTPVRNIH